MTYFESILVLMLAAVLLLQVSKQLRTPYPAMMVIAGIGVAEIPGSPSIMLEPHTALALFIAPALVDAAFDFPLRPARRLWAPLIVLAVLSVVATTAVVAWIGVTFAGLPLAVAIAMGAIVSPPDAAAAEAVLGTVTIPKKTEFVLKGESLFNDATALLIFSAALAVYTHGKLDAGVTTALVLAAPAGILFGIVCAYVMRGVNAYVAGTLRGSIMQFTAAFLVWIVAEHLEISAVLAEVAFAMTLARFAAIHSSPRVRVHSYAVWATAVFGLNVFAFLLMGMQARAILGRMPQGQLLTSLEFAGIAVAACIIVRMGMVICFNRLTAWHHRRRGLDEPASWKQAVLVGWSGMRGLLTLATAFALPDDLPQRDLVVLTAFIVLLATLVLQGLTLKPVIRLLGLDRSEESAQELVTARRELAQTALAKLKGKEGDAAAYLRYEHQARLDAVAEVQDESCSDALCRLGVAVIRKERACLEELRLEHHISGSTYLLLQEELDWRELALLPDEDRQIEEA